MNVLITSASRKVSLVRAFQRALDSTCGGIAIAGDAAPSSAALHLAERGVLLPRGDGEGFVDRMLELCAREDVGLVVPTRDEELPVFSEARQRFLESGVVVAVSAPAALLACQDKVAFLRFCAEKGFATPASVAVESLTVADLPVFIKPRVGKGGRGAQRVDDARSLEIALDAIGDAVVQRYCDLPEFTLDVFADFGSRVVSVVPRSRTLVVGGESFVSTTIKNARLISRGRDLVESLGLIGHVTVQCFWDPSAPDEEPLFIEVNPRYGGAASLGFAAGHPTPEYLVRLVLGEGVEVELGAFEDGLTMLRYTEDVFLSREDLAEGLQ